MNTSPRELRHFGAPLLIILLAATLGWFVQAIGIVAVVLVVVLASVSANSRRSPTNRRDLIVGI
jgi:hypothetical protein